MSELDEDLALDMQVYGCCFWQIVDGNKVRVHPRDVRRGRDGVWRDSTNTPTESNSEPVRLADSAEGGQ